MSKKVVILGSTGSIGRNALQVIDALGPEYEVIALSAHTSLDRLAEQAEKYKPQYIAVTDTSPGHISEQAFSGFSGTVLSGPDSLVELASLDQAVIIVCAVVGAAGLPAALAAAKAGKTVAIANKEPLVIAGELLTAAARQSGAKLLPIDSEHSAVFQAMQAGNPQEVRKVILTASGGPFRNATLEEMNNATVEQALNHPTWDMGPKITIDSATMMNKALEIIEAVWLFDLPVDKIDVLTPDMKVPIQYALTYPQRREGISEGLQLHKLGQLNFQTPDLNHFRALALGFEVAKTSGSAPVVFNAANEAAVEAFLDGQIRFGQIVELIDHCLQVHSNQEHLTLEELLEIDAWARQQVAARLDHNTTVIN
ncbi:MAG: 1-deoxy-D-xylulose-5-phosphate reductoisomerase [Planctomycetota bacterium]|jgi:1-deoxy-D-xylulose-5-phosphate reductoisomerase